jgi:ABC-type multidrug transport system ATPase subunit
LSGGQKQRIAIAGVLALKPRVMILDEATAMLDPRGRKEVMDVVLRLNREEKITVILITHFPEEALLADRAVVMHQGEIVLEGKPEELFKNGDELKKYALVMPRPIEICRLLTEGGLPVADGMDAKKIADGVCSAMQTVNAENIKTTGAGMRSNAYATLENGERGRVLCENLSYVYNSKSRGCPGRFPRSLFEAVEDT